MHSGLRAYQESKFSTISTRSALIQLHDRAISELAFAETAWQNGEADRMRKHIIKVQDIVTYLRGCIDAKHQMAPTLRALYDYYFSALVRTFLEPSSDGFRELSGHFEHWKSTWENATSTTGKGTAM